MGSVASCAVSGQLVWPRRWVVIARQAAMSGGHKVIMPHQAGKFVDGAPSTGHVMCQALSWFHDVGLLRLELFAQCLVKFELPPPPVSVCYVM